MARKNEKYHVSDKIAPHHKRVEKFDNPKLLVSKEDTMYLKKGQTYTAVGIRNYEDGYRCYVLENGDLYEPHYFEGEEFLWVRPEQG